MEVAAVPIPDEIGGEVIGVCLVAKKGKKITEDQIRQILPAIS